jgi:hypothetical protein
MFTDMNNRIFNFNRDYRIGDSSVSFLPGAGSNRLARVAVTAWDGLFLTRREYVTG